jgi:hypothetical protein
LIAAAIRDRRADYVLAVKDNQPKLAEAIDSFFTQFKSAPRLAHAPFALGH